MAQPAWAAGQLVLETNPKGASVSLDGEPIGQTPLVRDGLSAGTHRLTVSRPGYRTLTFKVKVEHDLTTRHRLNLRPERVDPVGEIVVESEPSGVDVYLDGRWVGRTPFHMKASAGSHRLLLRKRGYEGVSRTIRVVSDLTTTQRAVLVASDPEPAPPLIARATPRPDPKPTSRPKPEPTADPSPEPSPDISPEVSPEPSPDPTPDPTPEPTPAPTPAPTAGPPARVTPASSPIRSGFRFPWQASPEPQPTARPTTQPMPRHPAPPAVTHATPSPGPTSRVSPRPPEAVKPPSPSAPPVADAAPPPWSMRLPAFPALRMPEVPWDQVAKRIWHAGFSLVMIGFVATLGKVLWRRRPQPLAWQPDKPSAGFYPPMQLPGSRGMEAVTVTLEGLRMIQTGEHRKGLHALQEAYRMAPCSETAYNLARAWEVLGETDWAEVAYFTALQHDPSHRDAGLNLAIMLAESGEPLKALIRYRVLSELHPEDGPVAFNRGNLHASLDQIPLALGELKRAASLMPGDPAPGAHRWILRRRQLARFWPWPLRRGRGAR